MDLEIPLNTQTKNISYLRARDPSIICYGNSLYKYGGTNLLPQLLEKTTSSATTTEDATKDDNLMKVYLRIKKSESFKELYETVDDNTLLCKVPEGAQCIRNVRGASVITKTFTFSKIFGSESNQADLFNGVVKEKVLNFINGYNCSLLTYGASGSGKTFTIVGTAVEPGIVPRALEYLFRTLPELPKQPRIKPTASGGVVHLTESACEVERALRDSLLKGSVPIDRAQHTQTYKAMQQRLSEEPVALIMDDISDVSLSVWVSFAEIYNEYIYDLLKPEPARGQLKQKLRLGYSNGSAYIKDLSCVNVSSGLQAYHILQYGLHNLKYAATSLNDHSSRSHSIFTIKLAQACDTQEGVNVSLFNFCDLAGSERVKKTNNAGQRLKESNNINTSLLVLGRCLSLVRQSQKHNDNRLIPFRESKLTQLFQKGLQGHEAISMIVNINPTKQMFDESQHVLNFSAVAKDVIIEQPPLVQYPRNNRFSRYMEDTGFGNANEASETEELLQQQVRLLLDELEQQKLNSEEDREHVIKTYKQILEDTQKYWEDRCKELQDTLTKHLRAASQAPQQQDIKRRKTSVIILDSSSEDDGEDTTTSTDEVKDCKEKISAPDYDFIALQSELTQLKWQHQSELRQLTEKNILLEKTLEDAKKAYLELQLKYEQDNRELNLQILRKEGEINDLNTYLEAVGKVQAAKCDEEEEDQENIDPFCNSNSGVPLFPSII